MSYLIINDGNSIAPRYLTYYGRWTTNVNEAFEWSLDLAERQVKLLREYYGLNVFFTTKE